MPGKPKTGVVKIKRPTKTADTAAATPPATHASSPARPSSLVDTRVIYCGDNLEQLRKLPDACVDPIQVKQKDQVGRPDIDAFETAMRRANRDKGLFVGFDFSEDARHDPAVLFDKIAYRGRCVVEQCVGWLKEFRRIGTRFEKLAVNFHGMLQLAMIQRYFRLLF